MVRVTVGVPTYKNETTIAATIESILAQTVKDIEVIISEDRSPDGTWEICRQYEKLDNRIKLFRQEKNLNYLNLLFVLKQASAPYFVWLGGDDSWAPTYLEECLAVLETRPDVVGCVARCEFISDDEPAWYAVGTASLEEEWEDNVAAFFRSPGDNTRLCGLFRVEALRAAFPNRVMHAYDWAISAATLKFGKHIELPSVLMTRVKTPSVNYMHSVKRDHRSRIYRLFPVLAMSLHLIYQRKIPMKTKVLGALVVLNIRKHQEYMRLVHPQAHSRLCGFYQFLDRYIIWRL